MSLLATEHDMLQFLWSTYARAPRLEMPDYAGILLSTCSGVPCTRADDPGCRLCDDDAISWASGGAGSLEDGAQLYFGAGPDGVGRLLAFQSAAAAHGITQNLDP